MNSRAPKPFEGVTHVPVPIADTSLPASSAAVAVLRTARPLFVDRSIYMIFVSEPAHEGPADINAPNEIDAYELVEVPTIEICVTEDDTLPAAWAIDVNERAATIVAANELLRIVVIQVPSSRMWSRTAHH